VRNLLSFICLSLLTFQVSAQRQNVYYFTKDDNPTKSVDSMAYFRIVREPDSGAVLYPILEFYKDKKPKLAGRSLTIDPPMYNGRLITYYPNGKHESIAIYLKGRPIHSYYGYNKNGTLHTEEYFDSVLTSNNVEVYKVKTLNDTIGNPMVVNGNGYYKGPDEHDKDTFEEGKIVNGYKDGEWKGTYLPDHVTFTETYASGRLIEGKCITVKKNLHLYPP